MNRKFDDNYGCEEGTPFVAWTENFVYFSVSYDGAEWIECVPRNPVFDFSYIPVHIGT